MSSYTDENVLEIAQDIVRDHLFQIEYLTISETVDDVLEENGDENEDQEELTERVAVIVNKIATELAGYL